MCDRCAELEERVAWLESELGLQNDMTMAERLRRHFIDSCGTGWRGQQRSGGVRVILALFAAKGRAMSRDQLLEAIPPFRGGDDERQPKIVDVWVCWARKAIGRDAISSVWGRGYQLTKAGVERVAAIVGEHHQPEAA